MLLSDASPFSPVRFAVPLLEWHLHHGRQLPWMTKQPYDVWLSEVMLQQTQVSTVLERFAAFKKQFPTIDDLAAAAVEDVLAQWSIVGIIVGQEICMRAPKHWLLGLLSTGIGRKKPINELHTTKFR